MKQFWINFGIREGMSAIAAYLATRDPKANSTWDTTLMELRDELNTIYPPQPQLPASTVTTAVTLPVSR